MNHLVLYRKKIQSAVSYQRTNYFPEITFNICIILSAVKIYGCVLDALQSIVQYHSTESH